MQLDSLIAVNNTLVCCASLHELKRLMNKACAVKLTLLRTPDAHQAPLLFSTVLRAPPTATMACAQADIRTALHSCVVQLTTLPTVCAVPGTGLTSTSEEDLSSLAAHGSLLSWSAADDGVRHAVQLPLVSAGFLALESRLVRLVATQSASPISVALPAARRPRGLAPLPHSQTVCLDASCFPNSGSLPHGAIVVTVDGAPAFPGAPASEVPAASAVLEGADGDVQWIVKHAFDRVAHAHSRPVCRLLTPMCCHC